MGVPHPEPVSVLGLGRMGSALARAFLAAGHPTSVWNRTPAKAAPLLDLGASALAAPADARGLVVVCVSEQEALRELLADHAGRTVVGVCLGTSADTGRTAAEAGRHGVGFLKMCPLTTPEDLGGPESMTVLGGPPELFERHRETLGALGELMHLDPDQGVVAVLDLAAFDVFLAGLMTMTHAVALMRSVGLKAEDGVPLLEGTLKFVASLASGYARRIDAGDHEPDHFPLRMLADDAGFLRAECADRGVDPLFVDGMRAVLRGAATRGRAERAVTSLVDDFSR